MIQGYEDKLVQKFEYETTAISNKKIIGTCELGKATIQLLNESNNFSELKESWIKTRFGSFYVYDVAPVQEKINIKLSCYDVKYKLDAQYNSSKHTFPCTLKAWRNSIFIDCGVTYDDSDFPNSDLVLNNEPNIGNAKTNRQVLCLIAQAGCSFIDTDYNDKFYFRWFSNTTHIVRDWMNLTTEKEAANAINLVVLGRGDVEDIVYYPKIKPQNPVEFKIDNNYILDPQSTEDAEDLRETTIIPIYNRVNEFNYIIYNLSAYLIDNKLSIKLGDKINYKDIWGNELESVIMTKKLEFIGGSSEDDNNYLITLSAEKIEETNSDLKLGVDVIEKVNEVSIKADKNEKKIALTNAEVENNKNKIASLTMTSEEIKQSIEKIVDVSDIASGVGSVNITNGFKGILHKLDIYGTLELPIIVEQFIVNNFKITIKQGNEIYKEYIIDDMKNLYQVGTTHDTFEYLEGKCSITRRIGLNNDGTKYILDTPYKEELKDLNIEVPEGDYTISVNYNELHLDVEYLTKNEYTDVFATQGELRSEINARSNEIELLSKKKVNNDEVIASINLTPEKAQIDANKISLEGKEIDMTSDNININSTNFKVDKDGNCTANSFNSSNATITGGRLTLSDSGATINASVIIKNNILGYDTMTRLGANSMIFIDNDNDYNLTIGYDKDLYKGHIIRISGESSETLIESDMVQSPYFNQVSLKEYKKDFEKLDNALSIIKNTDIYKYHLKSQDDKEQKHIGLVIGDEFKYSKEILSPKQNGVDLYSMISTCFKAIQEQQEKIEELEKRIKELERN